VGPGEDAGASKEMEHLNGPESMEQIQRRHERFLAMSADRHAGCMYTIMVGPSAAGSVGYWETDWEGGRAWETGWFVLPEFQGLGVATQAMKLMIQTASEMSSRRYLVAFPSTDNGPSNAVAKKLGFELVKRKSTRSILQEAGSSYTATSGGLTWGLPRYRPSDEQLPQLRMCPALPRCSKSACPGSERGPSEDSYVHRHVRCQQG